MAFAEKPKISVSKEDWMNSLDEIQISKQDLNKLVMNFFLIEGKLLNFFF